MTERIQHSFCRFCTSLCGVLVTTDGDRVLKVRGDRDHPVSQGYTCAKGRSLPAYHHGPDRLNHPLRRSDETFVPTPWDDILAELSGNVKQVISESGPDAVGMYFGSGGSYDAAGRRLAAKYVRSLGSRSVYSSATVDAPAKPLVAELVTGNAGLFSPVIDFARATFTLLVGSNPLVSHGHTTGFPNPRVRLDRLMARGEVWVVDPRRTETAESVTRHLAPRPGTDHIWLAAILRELLADSVDLPALERRASGVPALLAAVDGYRLEDATQRCGLEADDLPDLLAAIRQHGRLAVQSGTGVTMSASANVTEWLLWALQIATDSLDHPGGTWINPGFLKSMDRQSWVATDGVPGPGPASRPELPHRGGELPAGAIADEIEAGNLRVLFVAGGNLVIALPDTPRLLSALAQLDILAVADVVDNEMTAVATHVLPCAGQLERADLPHVIDTYTCAVATQYTPALVRPAAQRRPMWRIFAELGERHGLSLLPNGVRADEATDDDVLAPLAARGRATLEELREADGGVLAEEAVFGWVTDKVLPGRRWRVAPQPLVEQLATLADPPDLVLVPRRQLRHLNSQLARTGTRDGRRDEPLLLLHMADAASAGVVDGQLVRVTSDNGALVCAAAIDPNCRRGTVSVPHGHSDINVNALTSGATLDPLTGMVLQSGVEVSLTPAGPPPIIDLDGPAID